MGGKKRDGGSRRVFLRDMMRRWASLSRQSRCPQCNVARTPEMLRCANCGAELPRIRLFDSRQVAAMKRPWGRFLGWLGAVAPGVGSPWVLGAVLLALTAAVFGLAISIRVFSGLDIRGDIASPGKFLLAVWPGLIGLVAHISGLGWLFYGGICSPMRAAADMRVRHWLLASALTVVVMRLAALVA